MENGEITLNGRYQLLERIGSGGMATVYKGQDNALGRLVAVKMLHESLTGDAGFLKRFQREAHAAANLTHPNIVTVHDIGQDGHRHYIVMEYVDGQTLKQVIRGHYQNGRVMPIKYALDLAVQICAGIGYAHRANLIHCDVKPQNILVTRDDRVKVTDFGIARAISEASRMQDSNVWGTPQYFAPEQAAGNPASPASDVYSIGIVLFEMLAGSRPFEADTPTAVALKHLQEQPPRITEYNPAVPHSLEQIIAKVLAKEPSGRYRTAGQLGRILGAFREQSLTVPRQTPPPQPITEQKTQVYQRQPKRPSSIPKTRSRETAVARPTSNAAQTVHIPAPTLPTDWLAISLGVIAVGALLGLIPLWFFVYQAWAG